jgi:hypothetical protein
MTASVYSGGYGAFDGEIFFRRSLVRKIHRCCVNCYPPEKLRAPEAHFPWVRWVLIDYCRVPPISYPLFMSYGGESRQHPRSSAPDESKEPPGDRQCG